MLIGLTHALEPTGAGASVEGAEVGLLAVVAGGPDGAGAAEGSNVDRGVSRCCQLCFRRGAGAIFGGDDADPGPLAVAGDTVIDGASQRGSIGAFRRDELGVVGSHALGVARSGRAAAGQSHRRGLAAHRNDGQRGCRGENEAGADDVCGN